MGIIAWIILGAVAGWIASVIVGRNMEMGCWANIAAGVLGALLGGFLMNLLGRDRPPWGLNLPSLIIAVLGAVIVLLITSWWSRR
jgi:uncharacterized membrane protein YeaQ/YmgE (transglycosylase-associated protein family)